ncbi:pentapeptide repeat-containing protein [uncultured Kordia sp.]|uniref:pentapeptide repeat-containing protein n=1 Tax=uncultured Kordia sp. TaxID=507699 RepID=UPI002602DA5B|nr:pentapeptide repeat-containing protein [uncultured Kordia sp.]
MITKETYAWIEELLNPEITEISDGDYNRLVKDYFQEDKRDWYKKNTADIIVKNLNFWRLIRKFSMPRGKKNRLYNFSSFVFPAFQNFGKKGSKLFWKDTNNQSFSLKVNFDGAHFLGKSIFTDVIFDNDATFENTKFENDLIIQNCTFKENVFFRRSNLKKLNLVSSTFSKGFHFTDNDCYDEANIVDSNFKGLTFYYDSRFHKNVNFGKLEFSGIACRFNESIFLDDVGFFECSFLHPSEFMSTIFSKKVDFVRPEFHDRVNFDGARFESVVIFNKPIFKGITDFSYCYFEDVNFKEINTPWRDRENYTEPIKLYFKEIFFNSNTFISNTNFEELNLNNCDVSEVRFSRCIWNDKENRLKLVNELPPKNIKTENQLKLSNENPSRKTVVESLIKKLRDSENHYRQLKKNFDGTKNWELSGKAYVSEMEMRKRRLWLERKYYQWFVFKFYDVFGGYTQDFKKPIVSLIGLILVFSALYFFIDYDISRALQRGVKGALPYMQIDTENPFEGYWLILRNLELVLGGTFLAFFVLALRKRFKQ